MEVAVPFTRPREPETLIFSKEFVEIKHKIVHVIKEETIRGMDEKNTSNLNFRRCILNIARFPRRHYTGGPTPIQHLPRLSPP